MTEDLVKIEQFHGIPVRVIMHNGRAMIPLNDISDGVGIDRSSLHKLLKRNEDILGEFVGMVIMTTPQGVQETVCLTRDGVTGILMKMDYNRSKIPQIKENIIGFQKWAIDTLSKIISGETIAIPTKKLEQMVRQDLSIVDSLVQFAHVDRGIATTVVLAKIEFETKEDLSWAKALIRKDTEHAPGFLNATQLGNEIGGLSPIVVNNMLASLGLQKYIGNKWEPTSTGKSYGENIPFTTIHETGSMHSGYQLKWRAETIDVLKEYLTKIEKQKQLQIAK